MISANHLNYAGSTPDNCDLLKRKSLSICVKTRNMKKKMQRRVEILPRNTLYGCKFQHFSKRISGIKAMQVYNLVSVMIINCRLKRVCQRQQYSTEEQPRMHAGGHAGLFGDSPLLDRLNSCFRLENIFRIVFSGNHCPVEYTWSVSYDDPQKSKITAITMASCAESTS